MFFSFRNTNDGWAHRVHAWRCSSPGRVRFMRHWNMVWTGQTSMANIPFGGTASCHNQAHSDRGLDVEPTEEARVVPMDRGCAGGSRQPSLTPHRASTLDSIGMSAGRAPIVLWPALHGPHPSYLNHTASNKSDPPSRPQNRRSCSTISPDPPSSSTGMQFVFQSVRGCSSSGRARA